MKTKKPVQYHAESNPAVAGNGQGVYQKQNSFLPLDIPDFTSRNLTQPAAGILNKISTSLSEAYNSVSQFLFAFIRKNRSYGLTASMDEYEKRKLRIFNQLNLFQFFTGIIVPLTVILMDKALYWFEGLVILLPPMISVLALYLNALRRHTAAMLAYFILYPFFTSLAYINGMDLGAELFFVLYGILSVFFLRQISYIIFCIGFSMINYFMLAVVLKEYQFNLEVVHPFFYLFNQLLATGFIFYGLYLIKIENAGYQMGILQKNLELQKKNGEIQNQKEEISKQVLRLEEQAVRLNELNSLKNRLFSIVSHDLKAPMYALRNVFMEIQQCEMKASEVNKLVPHIVKDLDYTTGLMENLLHWTKNQMASASFNPQALPVKELVEEITRQQRLQAGLKNISVGISVPASSVMYADKDMISVVIRNLLSNAIKFTPPSGMVNITINETPLCIECMISDTGTGISPGELEKIRENSFYSTKGTNQESGTGLGLMLCREFLARNGGRLQIESTPGKGSIFSFTVPKADL